MSAIDIFWFRRDLRLDDNHGLYRSLVSSRPVLPIFIFDPNILGLLQDRCDRRVSFIHQWLGRLQQELVGLGSSLRVFHARPLEVFRQLAQEYQLGQVHLNEDYEPYARQRDAEVSQLLAANNISFRSYKDSAIFAKDEVLKADGTPYTVYTPYNRRWHERLTPVETLSFDCKRHHAAFLKCEVPFPMPNLAELGFEDDGGDYALPERDTLDVSDYAESRDRPDWEKTSQLGVHLRFGTVSARRLVRWGAKQSSVWVDQIVWRDFFMQILFHFPHVVDQPFRPKYGLISWRNDAAEFKRWCEGRTGYPMVDAGMRQLAQTGYMHNRVRMVTASFLCKHLLIDWRWGEAWFARMLLDYDLAANNGNWQWCAGTGCDAAPYFRVFNPALQAEKFDPDGVYRRRWLPELGSSDYPKPMVEHSFARKRALEVYKKGVGEYENIQNLT